MDSTAHVHYIILVSHAKHVKIKWYLYNIIEIFQNYYQLTDSDPCSKNPCLNGATCNIVNITKYTCSCAVNFSGNVCQICNFKQ